MKDIVVIVNLWNDLPGYPWLTATRIYDEEAYQDIVQQVAMTMGVSIPWVYGTGKKKVYVTDGVVVLRGQVANNVTKACAEWVCLNGTANLIPDAQKAAFAYLKENKNNWPEYTVEQDGMVERWIVRAEDRVPKRFGVCPIME